MINEMYEKIKKVSIRKKIVFVLAVVFICMLVLNVISPLASDDFRYTTGIETGERVQNLTDILKYQFWHYLNHGGRVISITLTQLFLQIPKIVFDVVNSLFFVALIALIYCHARPKGKDNLQILILIPIMLWFLLPYFGQSCLWLSGACVYLWTTVIGLMFLLIFKNANKKDSIFRIIGMFLLGFLAGWSMENIAVGIIATAIGFLVLEKSNTEKIRKWQISGIVGNIIGFLILITAPGNFVRASSETQSSLIIRLIYQFGVVMVRFLEHLIPTVIIFIVLITIFLCLKKKIKKEFFVYLIGAFFSICAMIVSPAFPGRAMMPTVIFSIISMAMVLFEILESLKTTKKIPQFIISNIIIILILLCGKSYIVAAKDIINSATVVEENAQYIQAEKEKGNLDIVLKKSIPALDAQHNPTYGCCYVTEDPKEWYNRIIAAYYGVNSLRLDIDNK